MSQPENKHLSQNESCSWAKSQVCRVALYWWGWESCALSWPPQRDCQLQQSGDDPGPLWEGLWAYIRLPENMVSELSDNKDKRYQRKTYRMQEGKLASGSWHLPRGNIRHWCLPPYRGYEPKFGQRSISMACFPSANLTCAAQGCSMPHRGLKAAGTWQGLSDLNWPVLHSLWT